MSNGTSQTQIPPNNTAHQAESRSRKRVSPDENWLPAGWTTEDKVRTTGSRAGIVDKYYYEPGTGRKFRSRNEVLYYLEHGTSKKDAKKAENDNIQSENSQGQRSNKRRSKSNKKANDQPPPPPPQPPLKFDFLNIPEQIIWASTNSSWSPFIGYDKVQESVSREWDTAFTFLTAHKS